MPVFWGIFNLPYYALWGQVPNSMLTHHNCSSIGYWFKDWLLPLQWDLMLHKEQGQSWTAWIMQCTGMPDVSVRMGYVPGLCSAAVTNNPQMSGFHLSFNICVCVRVCVCVCVCVCVSPATLPGTLLTEGIQVMELPPPWPKPVAMLNIRFSDRHVLNNWY